MDPATSSDRRARGQLFLEWSLVCVLLLLPILMWFGVGDVGNDEAIYSFAAETMADSGDWLTPVGIYDGHPAFLEKPPLKIWLVAAVLELGAPPDNWGLRLVDVLLTILIFAYVCALGRWLGGRWAGILSCLVFFAMRDPLLEHGILSNNMESVLVLQYTAGMYHFFALARSRTGQFRHVLAMGLLFVLGFMSKFVAALFLPMIIVAVLIIHPGLYRRVSVNHAAWIGVGVIVLFLVTPWFVYQHFAAGPVFWEHILGTHVIERLTGTLEESHLQPWTFYLFKTISIVFESGAFLAYPIGFWFIARDYAAHRDPKITALFAWYFVPVILMSLMTSKLTHYLYPYLPPVAIVCGVGLARLSRVFLPLPDRLERHIGRLSGAVPEVWRYGLQLFVAVLPIMMAYGSVLQDIRSRPGPFRALQACMDKNDGGNAVPVVHASGTFANHVFSYNAERADPSIELDGIANRVLARNADPIWLADSWYRQLAVTGTDISSVAVFRTALGEVYTATGAKEPAFLLLPARFDGCGDTLAREGLVPLQPEVFGS